MSDEHERIPLIWPEITGIQEQEPVIKKTVFETKVHKTIEELLNEVAVEYSHISEQLMLLIGHVEFEMAISKLIVNNRTDRAGFPKNILNCLLTISQLHTEKYGHLGNNVNGTITWR